MVRVHIVQIVHIVPKSLRHVKVFGQFGHHSVVNVQIVQIVLILPEHSDWRGGVAADEALRSTGT